MRAREDLSAEPGTEAAASFRSPSAAPSSSAASREAGNSNAPPRFLKAPARWSSGPSAATAATDLRPNRSTERYLRSNKLEAVA